MAYSADYPAFEFGQQLASAFAGKRVLITGSGKDGGIGQALALAAAANGAKVVGGHFHSSYRAGCDLVGAISAAWSCSGTSGPTTAS
jgi:NAD(P)-dependent dehydrogenase (short-subunit alcohol dehydrogenase family)